MLFNSAHFSQARTLIETSGQFGDLERRPGHYHLHRSIVPIANETGEPERFGLAPVRKPDNAWRSRPERLLRLGQDLPDFGG